MPGLSVVALREPELWEPIPESLRCACSGVNMNLKPKPK